MLEEIAVYVLISGKVQGVGYRFSTRDQAEKLGLKGWVRNLPDRRVEALFQGNLQAIEKMLKWCEKGPSGAIVKEVKREKVSLENFKSFEIRY